jgi:2-haloacid dehalogenase/putative hydrolase of the HAD superfamily
VDQGTKRLSIRGILLDFYGTLVHEDDEIIPLICDEIRRHAVEPVTTGEIARYWSASFFPMCHRSHGEVFIPQRQAGLASLRVTTVHFRSRADPMALIQQQFSPWRAPPIFPDARPFLDALRALSIPVCIVSNVDRPDIEAAIAHHALRVDVLVTNDDARAYKPHPEMFHLGLELLGLTAGKVLHVGGSRSSDVAGAQAMNIPVAWINRSNRPRGGEPIPDYIVTDLNGVMEIITSP